MKKSVASREARALRSCHSWDEFREAIECLPNTKAVGDLFELLTKLTLLLAPEQGNKAWLDSAHQQQIDQKD